MNQKSGLVTLPINLSFLTMVAFLMVTCKHHETQSTWKEIITSDGSAPSPRHECGMIAVKDKLYLLGGVGVLPVDIYDPASNTWSQGATPPLELHHFQPVTYNGYIILIGAMTGPYPTERPVPNMMIYNPDQDRWIVGDSIPHNRLRGAGGTVVYKDKFYWVGGIRNGHIGDHKDFFDVYDPATRAWSMLPNAPRARDHFEAVVVEDQLYVLGGRRTKAPYGVFTTLIPEIDVYGFEDGTWVTLDEKVPTSRASTNTLYYQDHLILLGGEDAYSTYASTEVEGFKTKEKVWINYNKLPIGRHGAGASIWNDQLYISSGTPAKTTDADIGDLWVLSF